MEKFKKFIGLACLIGLMGFVSGVAQGAEITLRFAGNLTIGHHATRGMELLAKLVGEKTGGQVKILVYPAGQLFSDKDMMKAVPSGAVDMAIVTSTMWSGLVPNIMILDLPFFFKDRHHVWRALDGEVGKILGKDLEDVGVKLLHWTDGGFYDFVSKSPLRRIEDFKGKRIRVLGEIQSSSIKALGAAPTFLGGGEVYMALQRGTVDGAITTVPAFCERKYFEVTKHVTLMNYDFFAFPILMNLKKWNSLSPDIQKIILNCSNEVQEWGRKECEKMEKECLDKLKGLMEIYVWPEEEKGILRKVNQPTVDFFLNRTGEKGKRIVDLVEKVR